MIVTWILLSLSLLASTLVLLVIWWDGYKEAKQISNLRFFQLCSLYLAYLEEYERFKDSRPDYALRQKKKASKYRVEMEKRKIIN